MKRRLALLFSLGIACNVIGQDLTPIKINSGGSITSDASLPYYYSVGDLMAFLPEPGLIIFPLNISISLITGIGESDLHIITYPNPISDDLVIESTVYGELDIRDSLGRIVYQGRFPGLINLSNVKAGAYIVSLFSGQELLKRYKIIKM